MSDCEGYNEVQKTVRAVIDHHGFADLIITQRQQMNDAIGTMRFQTTHLKKTDT